MTNKEITIDVAKDFSPYPSGRVEKDGDFNGEIFRREILVPAINDALDRKSSVIIELDGVRTFGSSFLEEAFGGLGREKAVNINDALKILEIRCRNPQLSIYVDAIKKYLTDARNKNTPA